METESMQWSEAHMARTSAANGPSSSDRGVPGMDVHDYDMRPHTDGAVPSAEHLSSGLGLGGGLHAAPGHSLGGESLDMDELGRERMLRRKQSSSSAVAATDVPPLDAFICPITGQVMEDPVTIASGHTFERSAILAYFQEGNTVCPVTKVELPNQSVESAPQVRAGIEEWRARNVALRVQAARPKLASAKEEEVEAGLLDIFQLCEERPANRTYVSAEGLVPVLVNILTRNSRNLRRKTLATLANLANGNDQNKDQIVEAGSIPLAVRSLARDVGESRQAVALLLELSKSPKVCEEIGQVQGSILLLVTMLNSDNPKAAKDAAAVLEQLASNDQNVVQMAEANHFRPLAERLISGSEMTRIVMASALSRMSPTEQSKAALVQQGVIPPLVSMIASGKLEAKAAALGALQNLSSLPSNRAELIRGGIIPPLLVLLFSVTSVVMSLKEGAAAILANISLAAADTSLAARMGAASDGQGGGMAVLESEETIFQLLSLLNLATPNIQANLLRALFGMAVLPEASQVRARMISLGAIDVLIPFLDGSEGSPTTRPLAAKVLRELSREVAAGRKVADCLTEGQAAPLKAVMSMLSDKTDMENAAAAASLISVLPLKHSKLNAQLTQANAMSTVVEMLTAKMGAGSNAAAVRDSVREAAANALVRFTQPNNVKQQLAVAEMGAIPRLVQLLTTGNMGAKRGAAQCLGNFSESTPSLSVSVKKKGKGGGCCFSPPEEPKCTLHGGTCTVRTSFCLLEADAIEPLVGAIVEKEPLTAEAALTALSTLMTDSCKWEASVKIIHECGGFNRVVQQLSDGTERAKEKAVWMLEKLFRLEEYKFEYATKAQGALIEITQQGSNETKPVAAKILCHLELLHQQSSYF